VFRHATDDDLFELAELERAANLAGLGHVFPPERFPFPFEDVLARWRFVLDDPSAVILVRDRVRGEGFDVYVAYDDTTLRHLAVHPDRWGEGLARAAVTAASRSMASRGTQVASLWALLDNHRARGLYAVLGWRESEETREAPWPPHPVESRWTLDLTTNE
jgi:GNAT superfamily N-acetyltransferase